MYPYGTNYSAFLVVLATSLAEITTEKVFTNELIVIYLVLASMK